MIPIKKYWTRELITMRQKVNNQTSQQVKAVSNLGGPTSQPLDKAEKLVNEQWAKRFIELNGGLSS